MLQSVILIFITLILLPATVFSVPVSATTEEDIPTLQILNGEGGAQQVPLKAIQDTSGNIEEQDDYSIEPQDVVLVEQGQNFVLMQDHGTITKVEIIDAQLKKTELYFADNLVMADFPSAAYILDVIVQTDNGDKFGFVTFLVVLDDEQTISEVNTQNIITAFSSKNIETRIIFEDASDSDDDDNEPPSPEEEEPSICYFDQTQPECQPDENGDCPNGWPHNDNDQCHPGGKCPTVDGVPHERVDDDETGTCYPTTETHHCEGSGAIVLDPDDCAIYEPDFQVMIPHPNQNL